ncbi:MAG: hypothetical protein A2Z59_02160 [Nitrospinae bacterium RIFCSPLOWO2_02_39_17]|nr:MAG: hypothetical protein A2Z59_02160 [Nitrospinae bacterium RIFCSPLOWO2_02_39_17]
MSEGLKLKIADIVFSILPEGGIEGFSLGKNYIPFITEEEPDVVLETIRGENPTKRGLAGEKTLFDASLWNYCQTDGRHIFKFSLASKNNRPERILALEPDFKRGKIILSKVGRLKDGILQSPFTYPLDQLLMISILSQMQGLLVHSCGFKYKNKGYLFVGSSGAGKSTLSKIIRKNIDTPILNDDRIAVRKRHNRFYVYGTPWHGTAEFVSPEKAPLSGLFFLKKDTKNSLQRLSISDAVSRLFKCLFPPFWDREGLTSTLKICEDTATAVPSFEFGFTPDDRAFETIRDKFLI